MSDLPLAIDDVLSGSLNCFDKVPRRLVWSALRTQPVINATAINDMTHGKYSQRWCRQIAEAVEHFLVMLDIENQRQRLALDAL